MKCLNVFLRLTMVVRAFDYCGLCVLLLWSMRPTIVVCASHYCRTLNFTAFQRVCSLKGCNDIIYVLLFIKFEAVDYSYGISST